MTAPAEAPVAQSGTTRLGRDYTLLWTGQFCSMAGTMIQYIALPLWVLSETGSAVGSGLAFAVETLPIIILAPWAGLMADRYDRRRLVLLAESVSAVVVVAMALSVRAHSIVGALACAAVIKTINTISVPALQGLIRAVLPAETALPKAVSRFEGLTGATIVLGPPAGALLFSALGPSAALLANAASFVIGGACVTAIRSQQPLAAPVASRPRPRLGNGLAIVRGTAALRRLLAAEAAYFLFFGGTTAVVITHAAGLVGEALAGWYPACVGAAWLFVSMLILPARKRAPRRALLTGAVLIPAAAAFVAAMEISPPALLLIAGVWAGAANSLVASGASLGWQQLVEPDSIGQVVALRRSVTNGALALSSVALPYLADWFSPGQALLVGGVLATTLIVVLMGGRDLADRT
ncbi:MFS transporter [Kitasatospora sp. NPDC059408]|uniref:MFS transporter n=1 Tax=Kitasatospora sp. NPDC059408 TaxID=3346823 RepID=UPI0036B61A95